jgi:hypothetical protein
MNVFSTFYLKVAAVYALVGTAITVPMAFHYHSVARGISFAVLVLSFCIAFDFLTRYVIPTEPNWFFHCREYIRNLLTKRLDNSPEEPDDAWWEDDGVYEPFEPDGDHYVPEGDFEEDDYVDPNEIELSQVEDLEEDRGHEPELIEFEHDNVPVDEQEPKKEEQR